MPRAFPDHVEQITMLAGGSVGPFARGTLFRPFEPHEHRATRRVAHVADAPVATLPPSGRAVMAAHRLARALAIFRNLASGGLMPSSHSLSFLCLAQSTIRRTTPSGFDPMGETGFPKKLRFIKYLDGRLARTEPIALS